MKREPTERTCDCPYFARSRKFINHTYACLVKRRGSKTLAEYYGHSDGAAPRRQQS